MKNTKKPSKIIQTKFFSRFILIGGISISAFCMNQFVNKLEVEESSKNYVIMLDNEVAYGNEELENTLYKQAAFDLKDESYDINFAKICDNPIFFVDGIGYKAKDFYLRRLDDGTTYYSNLKDKDINLFTKEKMTGKLEKSMAVYKSSIFYDMYSNGLFNQKNIQVDKNSYQNYANIWDGNMHNQTYDNAITLKMSEYIEEKKINVR